MVRNYESNFCKNGGPGLAVPPYFTPGGPGPALPNRFPQGGPGPALPNRFPQGGPGPVLPNNFPQGGPGPAVPNRFPQGGPGPALPNRFPQGGPGPVLPNQGGPGLAVPPYFTHTRTHTFAAEANCTHRKTGIADAIAVPGGTTEKATRGPGPVLPNQANVVSCYVTSLSAIPEWHDQLRCNVAQCHSGMAWSVAV
ncbi:hypothetical protein Tcan_18327 [Toxocara canis]|uniref:Uncharacterized protein n=1 Tax=Toxocara canis TaxID=6265 RepID=A0A0B2V7R0_TOXCA|nr:hypothetical protein Tcan_18327 [Toxocara canis]